MTNETDSHVESAVAEGGAYEVIRKRLSEQGRTLNQLTDTLNKERLEEFGSSDIEVISRVRVRTENNCIARDMVQVGDLLVFGYNVFLGLKKETRTEDVFSLFRLREEGEAYSLEPVDVSGSFLAETSFQNDFQELYRYYKHTRLIQLTLKDGKLLTGFQIGERMEDIRVFRWSVSPDGQEIRYIDNRGERDIQLPSSYDFEWIQTDREDVIHGRHPHINILDKVFVETINGDLTIKIENNTEDGEGIYREPVEDKTQSLDDGKFFYAEVGSLILLKIQPYREDEWRYLIFNTMTDTVLRVDEIGQSCVQLPEDHGIVFPGGYYLQTGELKTYDTDALAGNDDPLKFKRVIRSPNGEDVMYIFYQREEGLFGLFSYNLITKSMQNPIYGHGYALAEDGKMIVFSAEHEPTRVHPMQIWQTSYVSEDFASRDTISQSFFGRIGNAALVRGVSDLYSIYRLIVNQTVSARLYEELNRVAQQFFDSHYWIGDYKGASGATEVAELLKEIAATAELVIDEFEKVQSIRQQSQQAMLEAEKSQEDILLSLRPENWETAEDYVGALARIRTQRGHLATIREYRYINTDRIGELDEKLIGAQDVLSEQTVEFLSDEKSLEPYFSKIESINNDIQEAQTIAVLTPVMDIIDETTSGLDLLSELMATLKVEDTTVRTRIVDSVSEVYSKLNQSKATARHKQKSLGSEEAVAQFSAQFKLFSQSIASALGMASTPEKCDEQLSRLLVQLEELESQFSDFDEFLSDIMAKRDEVYQSFETHKQQLLDERLGKAQSVADAAERLLASIERRSLKFTEADELNTYFASDALVLKTRDMVERLRELDAAVKADDVESRFKSVKDQAIRALRDKSDIYEDGGNVIKLGPRHKFSVNTQELDLTIVPRNGMLNVHLTGTDYFEEITRPELLALRDYWEMHLESETPSVYRAEYLAMQILEACRNQSDDLSDEKLREALRDESKLMSLVRGFASPRYKEGYEKGIHDHDAARLLSRLVPVMDSAGLLRFDPLARGFTQIFWANVRHAQRDDEALSQLKAESERWHERAVSAAQMEHVLGSPVATGLLVDEVCSAMSGFLEMHPVPLADEAAVSRAARYLVAELSLERPAFVVSKYATRLVDELRHALPDDVWKKFNTTLGTLKGQPAERWSLTESWLKALTDDKQLGEFSRYIPEAIALINAEGRIERRPTETDVEVSVEGLLGEHSRIEKQSLHFSLDEFLQRLQDHKERVVRAYHEYHEIRQQIIQQEKDQLGLDSFRPKPLSSFVRNRLINESYLPLIGDNLAKQMGTVGDNKRTNLMGMLMMISPPGYGKTTLMEYVASRLGLIFMKINCPSLGHEVTSLDPQQAPDATARQELEKLNLGLEMGNNVMLYLDDIQHTDPEFLQKFISLCDGTRRVDGVWKGKTKTYDMRGKKFCVVMAGNPYTETGEAFRIPDMLANRADIYNLGDILGGMDEQFALSYIENSLTSNPVLAPLATRELEDVYKLVRLSKGENIPATDLSHQYSGAEVNEITGVLKKLFVIQDVVLKINQQYIASAAQDDRYRTEPGFKLQGSYRNMNKMAEKVSSVMNDDELMQMISDHYLGESQLLTNGSEENLLKLAELRGNMTEEEQGRWEQIKRDFLRNKAMGGDEGDTGNKVVAQLMDLVESVQSLNSTSDASGTSGPEDDTEVLSEYEQKNLTQLANLNQLLNQIGQIIRAGVQKMEQAPAPVVQVPEISIPKIEMPKMETPKVEVVNQPIPGLDKILTVLADTMEHSMYPVIRSMDRKIDIDLKTHEKMKEISGQLRELQKGLES